MTTLTKVLPHKKQSFKKQSELAPAQPPIINLQQHSVTDAVEEIRNLTIMYLDGKLTIVFPDPDSRTSYSSMRKAKIRILEEAEAGLRFLSQLVFFDQRPKSVYDRNFSFTRNWFDQQFIIVKHVEDWFIEADSDYVNIAVPKKGFHSRGGPGEYLKNIEYCEAANRDNSYILYVPIGQIMEIRLIGL